MLGYNDMLQLLKGKIPGLVVIGDSTISIRGIGSLTSNIPPLILIDGNQASFGDLIRMPIFIVDRIDVLKSTFATNIYGFLGACGVINLITKAGGVPGTYSPPDYSAKHRISGYDTPRIFYSPQHLSDSNSDLNPDLRTTLYWNPDINLEGTNKVILNYYNGDNSSLIRIIAEGITKTGIPVTGKTEYEVR
jgi:outer membrane receptor protein involved in Fe transport